VPPRHARRHEHAPARRRGRLPRRPRSRHHRRHRRPGPGRQAHHVYVFPAGATLGAKKTVRVRTGKGTDTATNRYWNLGYYVWNNTSDTAKLRDANGKGGDACSWTTGDPGSTKVC
jgi:hypothetical protein